MLYLEREDALKFSCSKNMYKKVGIRRSSNSIELYFFRCSKLDSRNSGAT